jgi:hypothetical protein
MVVRHCLDNASVDVPIITHRSGGHKRCCGHHLLLWTRRLPPNPICITLYTDVQVQFNLARSSFTLTKNETAFQRLPARA